MKITGVRTQPFEITMDRSIGDANNPQGRQHFGGSALWLDTDEGVTGIALGGGPQVHSMVEELLVGRDPRGVKGLWKVMDDRVFKGGNRGAVTGAIGSLDVALWDLKARINGEPLWKTLGASTRKVWAYASGIDLSLDDEGIREFYGGMAKRGVCAGKLKCGLDLEMDLRRIQIMKDALATSGKTPELLIDVNEYWSPKQTIRFMHAIESHFDITWIEEPARRWDWHGLRKVSDNVRASVASGENRDEIADYAPLLMNRAVDVLNLGARAGGITGAMQIADMAYGCEIPVSMMNCAANFMAHLGAVLPNHYMMEVLDNGRDAVFTNSLPIEDGWIVLNDEPGLGFTFDEEKLKELAPSEDAAGRGMPWGRRRGGGMYIVGPDEGVEVDWE